MYPSSAFPIIIVSDLFFERHNIPTSAQIAASKRIRHHSALRLTLERIPFSYHFLHAPLDIWKAIPHHLMIERQPAGPRIGSERPGT
jgi:hypothetical protein